MRSLFKTIKLLIESSLTFLLVKIFVKDKAQGQKIKFVMPENIYHPAYADQAFLLAYQKCQDITLISKQRFQSLFWAFSNMPQGNVLDIGVLKGGSSIFFGVLANQKNIEIYSVDFWTNHFSSTEALLYSRPGDLDIFKNRMSQLNLNNINVCNMDLDKFVSENQQLKFSAIHFDLYSATSFRTNFSSLFNMLVPNGILLLGGYGLLSLNELTTEIEKQIQLLPKENHIFLQDKTGYGVLIKIK